MAKLIRRAMGAAGAAALAAQGAQAACLRYEPAQVVVVGRLAELPGGRGLALRLDRPICVLAGSGAAAAEGVRVVRVNFKHVRPEPSATWLGYRAAASGSLFRGPHDHDGELSLLVTGFGRAR